MIYPQDGDYYATYQYIPTDLGFQFPYDPNWGDALLAERCG